MRNVGRCCFPGSVRYVFFKKKKCIPCLLLLLLRCLLPYKEGITPVTIRRNRQALAGKGVDFVDFGDEEAVRCERQFRPFRCLFRSTSKASLYCGYTFYGQFRVSHAELVKFSL